VTQRVGVDLVGRLEAIAKDSPKLATGERELTVIFSNGKVRRAFVKLGPLRPDELDDALR
jgi:hypothetical protein